MHRYRFRALLGTLLLLMFLSPFVRLMFGTERSLLQPGVHAFLIAFVLFASVYALNRQKGTIVLAAVWAGLIYAAQITHIAKPTDGVLFVDNMLMAGFLLYSLGLLFHFLCTPHRVTSEIVAASLCGYLLLGVFWAAVFSMASIVSPDSFTLPASLASGTLHFGANESASALYFSYVTLTTLGYGDILPAADATRMLCTVEALTGQLYLAVVVARLVALQISHKELETDD